jgi:hypothetical protein
METNKLFTFKIKQITNDMFFIVKSIKKETDKGHFVRCGNDLMGVNAFTSTNHRGIYD